MRITHLVSLAVFFGVGIGGAVSSCGQQATSSPAAVDQYRAAVAMQNRQMYDLAGKEWSAFLQQHAEDPLAAKAMHYLGVCYFQQGEFKSAEQRFTEVIKKHPNFELVADSMLNLGLSQFNQGRAGDEPAMRRALTTLTELKRRQPESGEAKQASLYIAEAHYALGELDEAVVAYEQTAKLVTDKQQRAKLLLGYGVVLQDKGQQQSAQRIYNELLALQPAEPLERETRMRRADTLLATGNLVEAEKEFARLATDSNSLFADYIRMRLASTHYAGKQYAQAAQTYVEIAERFPDSEYTAEAIVGAGKCYYLAKSYQPAETWLQRGIAQKGEIAAEAAHWMARTRLARNDAQGAFAASEQAIVKFADSPFQVELRIDRADALNELPDQKRKASQAYAEIAKRFPDHGQAPYALYMAAFAALDAKQFEQALQQVSEFLDRHPDHELAPDVLAIAAESHLQMGEHAKARKIYWQLFQDFADAADADLWRVRSALCANLADQHQDVIETLEGRASSLKDAALRGEAHFLLGAAYVQSKDYTRAIRELKKSIVAAPQGAQTDRALLLLAKSLRNSERFDQAWRVLEELSQRFPDSKLLDRALLERAEIAAARGDYQQAGTLYEQLMKTHADSSLTVDAVYGWGWSLIHAKRFEPAKQVFDKLLAMEGAHDRQSDCHYARAVALQQLGKADAAIQDLDRYEERASATLKGKPLADARYLRGLCLAQQSQFEEAIDSFRAALRADVNYVDADKVLYELAWALHSSGKPENAARSFRKLAEEYPQSDLATESLYRAAEADFASQNYRRAAKGFAAAARAQSHDELTEQSLHKLGWCLYQLMQFDEALGAFQSQLQKYPGQALAADAQLMVGECLFKKEEFANAWKAYETGFGQTTDNEGLVTLALLHAGQSAIQQTQWQASLQPLDRLLQKYPNSPHAAAAEYEKGWALQKMGNTDAAEKHFLKVAIADPGVLGAKARFMQGEIQFLRGDFDAAIATFFKVAYGYGHPESPDEFHEWQANSIFEAARCCESTKRLDAAQKLYKELASTYPDCDKATSARQKLRSMETSH